MNYASPKKLAIFTAAIICIIFLLVIALSSVIWALPAPWFMYALGGVVIFGISFLMFYFILRHFIYEKIRVIYKTIHDLKTPRGKRREIWYDQDDMIRKANEEVLEWASDRKKEIDDLKKMESYRREFLGNVSHELKTPIFNIQGYVLTLLDGGLEDPEINRNYLLRTEKSINRMISIIEDLETISRLESGEIQLEFTHFDMVSLVREVMEMMEMEADRRKIRMVFGRSYESAVMVNADRKSIQQVVTNLMVNALKYGTENGRVKVSFFDMDEHILTEVTDSGIGIAREEIPRVFERFYRGEKSRSRNKGGGSGLGLAIVKHIIEAHHQTINVRSTLGIGTTFAFTLKKGMPGPGSSALFF
ncbi:MAG: sensor histidine kinase [Bacteroidia bacterium]|nr:MAG: sensor histidine kinase [Bacteroidia bacterium]